MPRIRSIHPEACDSEKLAMLSDSAERTFFRLLTHADDDGRGEDRPKLLAAKLYPLHDGKDAGTVDEDLDEIEHIGLLVRYRVAGKRYFAIPTFKDWQKPRHPTASKLPPPEEADPEDDDTPTADRGKPTAERGNATDKRDEPPHGEGVGVGGGVGEQTPLSTDVDPEAEEQFAQFWEVWPKRNGKKIGKGDALRKWKRLTLPERRAAFIGAKNYADACADPNVRGVGAQDAFRWLEKRRWEDWQDPARPDQTQAAPRQDPIAAQRGAGWR